MVALVGRYVAFDDPTKQAGFVWYLSTAPETALTEYSNGAGMPKALGQACLDIAITESFNAGLSGRIGLHADPKDETDLPNWYRKRKMSNLAVDADAPTSSRRNDGRYFFYTPQGAYEASISLNKYRPGTY